MKEDNLNLYNEVRGVSQEAQKTIGGGRLKGMTDINPMWRIKTLTEQFGVCGIGWYTETTKQWIEQGANGESCAFVNINLFVKVDGEWSKPIQGVGGSMFTALESKSIYENDRKVGTEKVIFVSDECFKMAYTDAISVACKALGFGADVYWNKDRTKYDQQKEEEVKKADKKDENNDLLIAYDEIKRATTIEELTAIWKRWPMFQTNNDFVTRCTQRKNEITNV